MIILEGCLPITKIDGVFRFQKLGGPLKHENRGSLPFTKQLSSSSVTKIFEVVFHLHFFLECLHFTNIIEVVFHLQKRFRLSSIYQKFESIFDLQKKRGCQHFCNYAVSILFWSARGQRPPGRLIMELTQFNCKCKYQLELRLSY